MFSDYSRENGVRFTRSHWLIFHRLKHSSLLIATRTSARQKDAWPEAPAEFKVELYADGSIIHA
jgi:hypothetical protein